jgi:uncharacterized protein YkwD
MGKFSRLFCISISARMGVTVALALALAACGKKGSEPVTQQVLTAFERMELEVFDGLNALRLNPRGHVAPLESMLERFRGDIYTTLSGRRIRTNEGPAAVQEAIGVLNAESPLGTYTRNRLLDLTARDHQRDQEQTGEVGHDGSDGSNPGTRAQRYARFSMLGENIAYGKFDNGQDLGYALFIDDGVPDRGHRVNMLEPDFREVGIACGAHSVYGAMCVINYGTNIQPLE